MTDNTNISIKLELCRDKFTNSLSIVTHFDPNAPNFYNENGKFFWVPTPDEVAFLKDATDLIDSWRRRQPLEPPMNRFNQPLQPEKPPFSPQQPRPTDNYRPRSPPPSPMDNQDMNQAGPNTSSTDNAYEKHMDRDRFYIDENEQRVQRILEKKLH
ncbi:MAG: hypothetical protein JXA91_06935 [Candidatus Thermoplasmatota archaeon]|nr:hypothetical protein [Candidatus Thermoplasmatota archaeon]